MVDTSKIDFVNREQDLALLLKRLSEPIKGKQYFLPPETQEMQSFQLTLPGVYSAIGQHPEMGVALEFP